MATREARSTRVLVVMWVGLALTVAAGVYPFVDRTTTHLLADRIQAGYPTYSPARIDSAVSTYLVILAVVGALGVLAWLATTWAVRVGTRWARPAATVLLVLGATVGLTGLLTKDTSGATGLPPTLGWLGLAPCLAGVVVVVLLWTEARPSRQ